MTTSLERGTDFEVQLHALFAAHGYRASHNVRMTGRSGAEHQIDVYAELELPLQVVRVIVEAKAHGQPVDKDALLKLQQIVDDLGADRGVLATTSAFTTGALKMAESRNVDLWDRDRVSRLLGELALAGPSATGDEAHPAGGRLAGQAPQTIVPRLSLDEARWSVEAAVERRRRGGLFRVGRVDEELVGIALVHEPYYEITLDVVTFSEERRGLRAREVVRTIAAARLSVDAHTGAVVSVDAAGRLQPTPHTLPELTPEEAEAVKALGGAPFTRDDLLGRGYRPAKAQQLLATLQAKGLLASELGEGRKAGYRITGFLPLPIGLQALTDAFELEPLQRESTTVDGTARSQAGIVRALEALVPDTAVRTLTVVYYPCYAYELQRPDGSRRQELLDGLTGELRQLEGPRGPVEPVS